jgi:hypothetical protein
MQYKRAFGSKARRFHGKLNVWRPSDDIIVAVLNDNVSLILEGFQMV